MLEDSKLDAELIKDELTKQKFDFTSELVETEKDFITAIHNFKPDIILSDYSLPQFTGFEALKIAQKIIPNIPFIIITGSLSEETAADSIKKGAWDYVLKENLLRLIPAIENAIKLKVEKNKNKLAEEKIRRLSKVVETTPEAVVIADLQGKIEYVNQGLLTLGDFEDDSLIIGKSIFMFSNEEGIKQLNEIIIPTILSKGKWIGEVSVKRKDNSIFPTEMICSLILDAEGKPKNLLSQYHDITNRKQTEKELRESEEKFRVISESAIDSIFIKDINSKYIHVNPAMEKLFGLPASYLIGKTDIELFGEEAGNYLIEQDKKVFKKGILIDEHKKTVRGELHSFHTIKVTIKNSEGKVIGLCGIARDTTEKKKAEENLRESEKQLQTLIDNMPDFVCFKDRDSHWLKANEAAIRIFQLDGIDYRGKNDSELAEFNSKLRGSFLTCKESDAKVWKENDIIHAEETIPDSEGSARIYDVTKVPVSHSDGKRKGIVIIGHDITERKQAEQINLRLAEIIRNTSDGVILTNLEGKIHYINPAFEKMSGYKRDELLNKDPANMMVTKNTTAIAKEIRSTVKTQGEWKGEVFCKHKNGEIYPILTSVFAIKNSKGELVEIASIQQDISDRKLAEEKIKKSKARYQHLVDNSPDFIAEIDNKMNIISINLPFAKSLGNEIKDIINKNAIELFPEHIFQKRIDIINKSIKENLTIKFEDERNGKFYENIFIPSLERQSVQIIVRDITENKRVEKEIKAKNIFLKSLIQQSPFPTFVMNSKGFNVMVNEAFLKFYSVPNKEMILGRNALTEPANVKQNVVKYFKEALTGKIVETPEIEFISPYKNKKTITKCRMFPILDPTGTLTNVVVMQEDLTERNTAVKMLQESEKKFRDMTNLLPQIVYEIDIDGNLTYVNNQAFASFGYSHEEFKKGINVLQKLIPEDRDRAKVNIRNKLSGKKIGNHEYTALRKDGITFPILIYSSAIFKDNKPIGLRGIIVDISERKQAEEALKRAHNNTKTILEKSPFGVVVIGKDRKIKWINETARKMTGVANVDVIIGENCGKYLCPAEQKECPILDKGQKIDNSERILRKYDGKEIPIIKTVNEIIFNNENVLLETFIDITDRKQAEEAIQKSEKKYRLLADNSIDVIWKMNLKLFFTYVSPSIKNITGHTVEEWVGSRLSQHSSTKEFFSMARKSLNAIKNYKKIKHLTFEAVMLRKDGTEFPVEINTKMLFNKKGLPIGFQGTTHEITERKQAEAQIKKDLKEKTSLLQELYHRTKNNMQVISAMLKMQSRRSDNEFTQIIFKEIINKITAMSLVHQKLYQAQDISNINLKEYIQDLIMMLKRNYLIQSKKLSFKLEMENIFVLIDSAIPLGLIFNELISNVFKHAFPNNSEGEINIKLYKEVNGTINIHLSDNGIGIPNNFDLEKLKKMGLQTMYSLIKYQLRGEVSYEVENGLKWHIKFKDNIHKKRV